MSFTVDALREDRVVLVTVPNNEYGEHDLAHMRDAILSVWATFPSCDRYFVIFDLSDVELTFSDVVMSLADVAQHNDEWDDRMVTIFIGQDEMVELAAAALRQEQYGAHESAFFPSVDEALTIIRQMQAEWAA